MRKIGLAFLCVTLLGATTSSAQSTGSIAGIVKDTSGAVLPGVTVEAASPALIEKVRTAVTDASGAYKVEALRPGTYSVTFTLPGFASIKREGIELTSGFTAALDADMRVGSVEETITVTGASPIVDVQNVTSRTVITKDVLDNVVMNKSVSGYVQLLLGGANAVNTRNQQDVAGSTGEFPAQIAINGGRAGDQTHLYDGLRMVSSMTGNGGGQNRNYYPNMLMVQEVALETNSAPASIESGGIQTNYVPKDGGNLFKFVGVANGTGPKLQGSNLDDHLRSRGVLTEPGGIKKVYNFGAGMGGPIKTDRLWFFGAAATWTAQTIVAGTYYNANPGSPIYTADLNRPGFQAIGPTDGSGRITWQITQKQKLNWNYGQQTNCLCGFTLGPTVTPEAQLNQHYHGNFSTQGMWNYVATNRLLFRVGVSGSRSTTEVLHSDNVPASPLAYTEFPRGLNYGNRLVNSATTDIASKEGGGDVGWYTRTITGSASYVTGSHSLMAGANYFAGGNHGVVPRNKPDYLLPVVLGLNRATPTSVPVGFQIAEFVSINQVANLNYNMGFYAQDQWTLKNLTVNAGVRADMLNASTPARCKPVDLFTPELCTTGIKNVPDWQDISPRLGVAYDLFGNGKTAVKAALGRYVIQDSLTYAAIADPLAAISATTTRPWNDLNGDYFPDCDLSNRGANGECGANVNPLFGSVVPITSYADNVIHGFGKRPYQWQGQLSIQHELRPGVGVTVAYNRTSYGNFQVVDNLNVTPADYDPYCLTVPTDSRLPNSGQQSCGWYDITPAAQARGPKNLIRPVSDFGKQTEVFQGITAQATARFARRGIVSGGINTGRTVLDSCFVVDSPQVKECHQVLGWAAQRQVKAFASYPLGWGVILSGVYQNLPGVPDNASLTLTRAQALTNTTLGRPFAGTSVTTTTSTVTAATGTSFPPTPILFTPNTKLDEALNQLDLRLAKDFHVGRGRIRASMDVGNVLNSNSILTVATAYTPTGWLTPSGVLAARIVKFGAEIEF